MTLKKVWAGIVSAVSIVKHDAEKVAPEIQAKIDEITRTSTAQIATLKSGHTIAELKAQADKDIQQIKDFAVGCIDARNARLDAEVKAASASLPPLQLPVQPVA